MKSKRVLSVFALVVVMLLAVAACIPAAPEVDTQGVSAPETFKSLAVKGLLDARGTLNVDGASTFNSDVTIVGDLVASSIVTDGDASLVSVSTTGNITDAGNLIVDGTATIGGAATITGALTLIDSVSVGGGNDSTGCDLTSVGNVNCAGNGAIGGALVVTGAVTFDNVFTVNGNGDFDSISTAGNIDMTTMNNTGANPVTINDDLTITGTLIYSTESITPADGLTITPTASIVTLTPAGAVGITLAPCISGKAVILYNSVNANVVITDTGDAVLAGNQTLGQYDTLHLACYDSNWVQVSAVSAN